VQPEGSTDCFWRLNNKCLTLFVITMKSFDEMHYNPQSEKLVEILGHRTRMNPLFLRVLVGYYFAMVASQMRASIATHDRGGDIPVSLYALNLSPSGTGKGVSTGFMENEVLHLFRERFLNETFPLLAEQNLPIIANKRAARKGTDPDDEMIKVQKEFDSLGTLAFNFDSGTIAAVKQMRHKLLMANAGSVNLQIDEIGANLVGNIELLNAFFELYDTGTIKQKLTKNTAENPRNEEIVGRTPTNMLLFGAPSKLLNGGKTEEELYSMLESGYARRCFFGYNRVPKAAKALTPQEVYDLRTNQSDTAYVKQFASYVENLADIINVNRKISISKETTLTLIEYQLHCEALAENLAEHEEIKKTELSHRYFKALKLAGAYAFIENSPELTEEHLYQAIKLAEASGEAFNQLLTRDRNYVKLAKYIASCKRDVTQADLVEDLPFYRGAAGQKAEMMTLAVAYGYKNNIIIKKSFEDGIEFFRGETLEETDLNKMVVAYSDDIATGYQNEFAPFDKLYKLTQAQGLHWINHHLIDGHRQEESCKAGFNLAVVDVDGGVNISTVKMLLKGYQYLLYTTKRHTDEDNRFRLIFPMNYTLDLDAKDYKEFMSNLYEWLPFEVDTATNQRARKWLSHSGHYEYNDGDLLDVLPFIPKTSKNEERKAQLTTQSQMDNLERWVLNKSGDGNRNNMLLRYALILVDAGFDFEEVRSRVVALNNKMPDKLDEAEIMGTIMITVMKQLRSRP
jgi:hypothetical protein